MSTSLPLIVFVHVPKTGGMTIINNLYYLDQMGMRDCHKFFIKNNIAQSYWDDFAFAVNNYTWISGHFSLTEISNSLIWSSRSMEFYASIREPTEQIISHLNFSLHRMENSDYFKNASKHEIERDLMVSSVNYENPYEIMEFLHRSRGLFLNNQARTLIGNDCKKIGKDEIDLRFNKYSFISASGGCANIYNKMGYNQLPPHRVAIRDNASPQIIKKDAFYSEVVQNFLQVENNLDHYLWNCFRERATTNEIPSYFRKATVPSELFTDDNFDESDYLQSCPDVALALCKGQIESGWSHFQMFGKAEARTKRVSHTPDEFIENTTQDPIF